MRSLLSWLIALVISPTVALTVAAEPFDIRSRRELFVEQALVERLVGRAEFRIHHPMPREVAITFEKPWEGNASGYATVIQDGDLYRMYYRGHRYIIDPPPLRQAQSEVVCYAESRDGVHWVKPNLGLFDWPPTMNNAGTKENNILWRGGCRDAQFRSVQGHAIRLARPTSVTRRSAERRPAKGC